MTKWKKIVGTALVLIVAAVLVFLIISIMNRNPSDVNEIRADGDWTYDGQNYSFRSHQELVLFLGVTDGPSGPDTKLEYITLVAVDDIRNTYSMLNIDPDTCVTVSMVDNHGMAGGESYEGRIAEAMTFGNGGTVGCKNVERSLKPLLHGGDIDRFVAVRTGGQKPLFVTDPAAQLEAIMNEEETDQDGDLVSMVVSTDIKEEKIASLWSVIRQATRTGVYTLEGQKTDDMLILDTAKADDVICNLYFEIKTKP